VKIDGKMDVDPKAVQIEAFGKQIEIAKQLRNGREYRIPSLGWTIDVMPSQPVNTSVRSWDPYKQAEDLQFYPFKQAAQFTTGKPFMLIFAYLPRFNPFLQEDPVGFTEKFFRSLARRAFIGLSDDTQPLSIHDLRVKNRTLGDASRLLSGLMFVDLESERYQVFFNSRTANPIARGIEHFAMNSHPITDLASCDDFAHDNY
jgi:hypothetical protein